jgi:hypothetical protein
MTLPSPGLEAQKPPVMAEFVKLPARVAVSPSWGYPLSKNNPPPYLSVSAIEQVRVSILDEILFGRSVRHVREVLPVVGLLHHWTRHRFDRVSVRKNSRCVCRMVFVKVFVLATH